MLKDMRSMVGGVCDKNLWYWTSVIKSLYQIKAQIAKKENSVYWGSIYIQICKIVESIGEIRKLIRRRYGRITVSRW